MKNLEKIIKVVEDLDWSISVDGNDFELRKFSPSGQDFNLFIIADDEDDFISTVRSRYENFDVSYETYIWLDDNGHGTNGAPYDMKDLYEDMEACQEMISELVDALEEIDFEEE